MSLSITDSVARLSTTTKIYVDLDFHYVQFGNFGLCRRRLYVEVLQVIGDKPALSSAFDACLLDHWSLRNSRLFLRFLNMLQRFGRCLL